MYEDMRKVNPCAELERILEDFARRSGHVVAGQFHLDAAPVCIDLSKDTLDIAPGQLPAATFNSSRLEDELPVGPFDLVVSAFAIHHLDGEAQRDLFRRVAQALSPRGCFAFLDVVAPTAEIADPIAIEDGVDKPSAVADMMHWLEPSRAAN